VQQFAEHAGSLSLFLSDVIMPKMNGKAAYEQIRAVKPGIKAIFMSGYTADIIQSKGIANDGIPFLPKPIFPDQLLRKVREVLDA